MATFTEHQNELTEAKQSLDTFIAGSSRKRLQSVRVIVECEHGSEITAFDAPVGVLQELVSVGVKSADLADKLVTALTKGLDGNRFQA